MPTISGLATTFALTEVENIVPNISSLVKKKYNIKINVTEKKLTDQDHDKYFTTPEFNNSAARVFTARLARANLITITDFGCKQKCFNQKINSNKRKHLLVENESKKL